MGTGIEAEPTEPEDKHAESSRSETVTGNGITPAVLTIFSITRPQNDSTCQGKSSTHRMNNSRTCEVVENCAKGAHHESVGIGIAQPASAPRPMALNGIDEQGDENAVNTIHRELSTLRHGPRYDSGTRGTEHRLENQETFRRQIIGIVIKTQITKVRHSDETLTSRTEHKAKTHKPE